MDARAYLLERAPLIERGLESAVPDAHEPPVRLHAAMRHLLFPGGKRLRPVLALAAAEAVGAPPERALPMATAVELIHTYSLIHDDLPCMDDDAERRGRPTVHRAFDEAIAVLAGDALQAAAFAVLLGERGDGDEGARRRFDAARELAEAAGSRQLVGGQADDLGFRAGAAGAVPVESVHQRKTAALIAVAIVGGARLGGADESTLARLRRFGGAVGVVFQISDDLLDAGADEGCSLVAALGPAAARARGEALLVGGLCEIENLGERAEPLRALAHFALRRSA